MSLTYSKILIIEIEVFMSKLVVFDLDGTLNQTEIYAVKALEKALEHFNVRDVPYEKLIGTFGGRIDDYIHDFVTDPTSEDLEMFIKLLDSYEEEFIKEFHAEYDGVTKLLTDLRAKGYKTAICSNAYLNYIEMVLDVLNLNHLIDYIQPLEVDMNKVTTLRKLINYVAPEKVVMVGDRHFDKQAARENNIPFIGCLYGFNKDEIIDADRVVSAPCEILAAVDELLLPSNN